MIRLLTTFTTLKINFFYTILSIFYQEAIHHPDNLYAKQVGPFKIT